MSKCESCGVNWTDHLGVTGTCKRNGDQAEEIAKLKAEIERLHKIELDRWISIRDQLPPTDRQVLFCCELDGEFTEVDLGQFDGGWTGSKNAVAMALDDDWAPCSHWMELPKPPAKTVS